MYEYEWQKELAKNSWKLAQEINIDKAVPAIIGLLQEEDIELKELAIETLGKIKDRRAVEPLIKLLDDKTLCIRRRNWTIADMAAWALWEIGDERAIEPMIKAGYYGWKGKVSKEYREKTIKLWREALEKLPKSEQEEYKYKRLCLLIALGRVGDSGAISALVDWLEREKERTTGEYGFQDEILEALGKIGNDKAVEVLIKSLDRFKEGNYRGGGFLIKALGNTKSKKAIKPLERLLNDKYVGEFAAQALKKTTGKEYTYKGK
jgi:HEAT repeat protein